MKSNFSHALLPSNAILITCSSHEDRCTGLASTIGKWKPSKAILFHYDDTNPKREENHRKMENILKEVSVYPIVLQFTESNAVKSLHDNMGKLCEPLSSHNDTPIILDISVFTKRHLLMMLRWLDDKGYWDRLCIVYSEPDDYDVSKYIPLSFGISSIQQIPGFSACPDLSRPVHLALFLGYEGDRALAVYDYIQPMQTTLIIPHPPYKPSWSGRTEDFNADLLTLIGSRTPIIYIDAIDPDDAYQKLVTTLGNGSRKCQYAKLICPLGTKPQTLGLYYYLRKCSDPPAIVYASPLRHNHDFFSHGIGKTWILKQVG